MTTINSIYNKFVDISVVNRYYQMQRDTNELLAKRDREDFYKKMSYKRRTK